jgi:Fe/S biogenesis protein NfuA
MTLEIIQRFVDEYINPALAAHSGVLTLSDLSENTLYVRLGGGCQGCAASKITLQKQIKAFLVDEFPDLLEIVDLTDHASGLNPYIEKLNET